MSDSFFVDSNIFIYAHTDLDIKKQEGAQKILLEGKIHISIQVINEFINATRKKFKKDWKEISTVVNEIAAYSFIQPIGINTVYSAIEIVSKYKYSYYDSLIIAAAIDSKCSILFSEDLQHKQKINGSLIIVNPFK